MSGNSKVFVRSKREQQRIDALIHNAKRERRDEVRAMRRRQQGLPERGQWQESEARKKRRRKYHRMQELAP